MSALALLITIRDPEALLAITIQFEAHLYLPERVKWLPPLLEGLSFRAKSQPEKAIDFFNQALEKADNQISERMARTFCSYLIAQSYAELGEWSLGLPSIQEVFNAYPQDYRHWSLLARYYRELGQPQKAESILAKAAKRLVLAWSHHWDLAENAETEPIKPGHSDPSHLPRFDQ